ncbi:hypothetical protein H5410_053240 [Solanum commersonii]|uniref:Uncharacterized protein n=1 Tax=Solanum commersonii TaxID=4109 RepID=A0A9J5X5E7_SOLCO|nr:hypothetical protein H5410_053240 [Solanum commersonii]
MVESKRITKERRSKYLQDPISEQNLPQVQNRTVESSSTSGKLEKDDDEKILDEEFDPIFLYSKSIKYVY